MSNIDDITEDDLEDALIQIEYPTIPSKKSSTREWLAKQLQELALKLLANDEIISFEIKGNLLTKSCTTTIQISRDTE